MRILALLALVPALAFGQQSPASVVEALYRDFPVDARDTIMQQPRAVLDRYFAPELAAAIEADGRCVQQTHDVCNLDFVPQWDSNDPGAEKLQIAPAADDIVVVRFNYPGRSIPVALSYVLVQTESGWRISDIRGANWTLSGLLAVKSK